MNLKHLNRVKELAAIPSSRVVLSVASTDGNHARMELDAFEVENILDTLETISSIEPEEETNNQSSFTSFSKDT